MASFSIFQFLNILMNFSHIFLMIFILFGWFSQRMRIAHLIVVILTGLSWFIFIQSKGFGYCILTDWHWKILRNLGKTNLPETYIQYLYNLLTGLTIQKITSQFITTFCWIYALIFSSGMIFKQYRYECTVKITK